MFSQRYVLITIFWRVEYGKFNIWSLPLMCVLEVVGISDIRWGGISKCGTIV